MDELIAGLCDQGFAVVSVNFPRSYVDVNREPYELDPRMFAGRLPSFANTRSMRVAGGLGTIPRVVGDGQEIYSDRLSIDDALQRIESLYKPYHRALRRLIAKVHHEFGTAILVDCHSMPSVGVSREEPRRPDLVIGDRYGTSCAPLLADVIQDTMQCARLHRRPQQAVCRRLHHRALRQSRQRAARDPDRAQPRDLHGRAAARAQREFRSRGRRYRHACRRLRGDSAVRPRTVPGRSRIERREHSRSATIADGQEKRAACENKRPKSREETPKEGSGSAEHYRTATIWDRNAQNASPNSSLLMHIAHSRSSLSEPWRLATSQENNGLAVHRLAQIRQFIRRGHGRGRGRRIDEGGDRAR